MASAGEHLSESNGLSRNQLSSESQSLQTSSSERNLVPSRSQLQRWQNAVQEQPDVRSTPPQQISNCNSGKVAEINQSKPGDGYAQEKQEIASQQLQCCQHGPLQQSGIRTGDAKHIQEQYLLNFTQEARKSQAPSNGNLLESDSDQQNENHGQIPMSSLSQAQTELLDLGPLSSQIKKQDQQLRQIKDEPMQIQSDSRGYLTEKQSHKDRDVYAQREKEWIACRDGQDLLQLDSLVFDNRKLFQYGFEVKRQKRQILGEDVGQFGQRRERGAQMHWPSDASSKQSFQVFAREDQRHLKLPVQLTQNQPITKQQVPLQETSNNITNQQELATQAQFQSNLNQQTQNKLVSHNPHLPIMEMPNLDDSFVLSSNQANLDSQLNYHSQASKLIDSHFGDNRLGRSGGSVSNEERALLGGYYDAESNSSSPASRANPFQEQSEIDNKEPYNQQHASHSEVQSRQIHADGQLKNKIEQQHELEISLLQKHSQQFGDIRQDKNQQQAALESENKLQVCEPSQQKAPSAISRHKESHQHCQNDEEQVESLRQYYQAYEQDQICAESVLKQLKRIHRDLSYQSDEESFDSFQSLISRHIDLVFLRPNDHIGQRILEDAEWLIIFAELMVLVAPLQQQRNLLKQYLLATLSRGIKINPQIYRQYLHQIAQRKTQKFIIIDQISLTENLPLQRKQEAGSQIFQHYSTEVHDASFKQEPESIRKSTKKVRKEIRSEMPLQRGRVEMVQQVASTSKQKETRQTKGSLNKMKKLKETKKRVTINEISSQNYKFGLTQTFMTMVDKQGRQHLKKIKVSCRLLQKQKQEEKEGRSQKKEPSPIRRSQRIKDNKQTTNRQKQTKNRSQSRRKLIKRTARKSDHQSQILDEDYIKSHFRKLKIDVSRIGHSNNTFLTKTDKKIAQMLLQYQNAENQEQGLHQQQNLILNLESSQPNTLQNQIYGQPNDEQQTSTLSFKNKPQLQKKLQKKSLKEYKILKQLAQKKNIKIQKIIDPNVNNHGNYALVKVKNSTATYFGARYFLIPMSKLELCSRKAIDEDLISIQNLVEAEERDNIGILKPTYELRRMVQVQRKSRGKNGSSLQVE